ncbi:MAG: hypothetical protein HY774_08595 [Acidobacteria bacterium]|nr:hypothetical protein [Acidobacteriota bacterium]
MPDSKQPPKPRNTDDILREMEAMAQGIGKPEEPVHPKPAKEPGALKSLLGFFVKIVPEEEDPPVKPTAAQNAQTQPVTSNAGQSAPSRVGDLVADESFPKFTPPEQTADDLSQKSFEEIYREAGITESQLSVDELEKLLTNPTIAAQPMSVKIIAINLALSAKGVTVDVPIADAVRRDRVLESYQAMLLDRARDVERRNSEKIQQITAEIEAYLKRYQAEIDNLHLEISELKRQSKDFALRREAEEQRLANLISPFLEGKPNPVLIHHQPESDD